MPRGPRKEARKLLRRLEELGCEIVVSGNGHLKVFRGKELLTVLASTPGDPRGAKNEIARLRAKGLDV